MMNHRNKITEILFSIACLLLSTSAADANPAHTQIQSIQSSVLSVTVDAAFPRVIGYTWLPNGAILYGQEDVLSEVMINGQSHTPAVSFSKAGTNKAGYTLVFSAINVSMTVEITVVDNVFDFRITEISETCDFKVKTIEFPNHNLVSVRSTLPKAEVAATEVTGYWNKISEQFKSLSEIQADPKPVSQTYLVINSDRLAATIDNNVIHYDRARSQTVEKEAYKKCGIWNGVWTYRELDSETLELPWSKVIIVPDKNGDAVVDWQDGAIGYREHMNKPVGSDLVKNSISYISFNGGSVAITPFLRALEDAKQLSLMIDGFGQMIELKGYQSEGHDAAHPDCAGNYNTRAGGLRDLQTFLKYAPQYNIQPGVHINVSESYPEAKNFNDTILRVPHVNGWKWYDQSLKVDYRKDIVSGSLYSRLDQMASELPGLVWVYVDVYGDYYGNDSWDAYKLGTKLNSNGWLVASEYFGPMERQLLWVHHTYAVPDSKMIRFIKNHMGDMFRSDPLLKGAKAFGVGGWENNYNFHKVVHTFYTVNLPTRYMQHFPITKMSANRVDFENGVHVDNSNGWKLYKNNRLIGDGENMFIPWDPINEKKIYHWNAQGGSTTWDVPDTWSKTKQIKLYKLTGLGKEFVSDLTVLNGRVTISAEAKTPHVIYRTAQTTPAMDWGQGSFVKDQGFSSRGFSAWSKSSTANGTDHIAIEVDDNANSILTVNPARNSGADAAVSQKIEGLAGGKTYSASVWANVTGGRKAAIGIKDYGGADVADWVNRTDVVRSEGRLKFKGSTYQRLRVLFDMPAGRTEATLCLSAETGDPASTAEFDDVRIAMMGGRTSLAGHDFFEDFENIDEQWGPFIAANATDFTHLSELNPGHTDDTINGRFSLKNFSENGQGEIYRTVQSTLKLTPNTRYQIGFHYINDNTNYRVTVRTKDGGQAAEVLDSKIPDGKGVFTTTFTTKNHDDYYVAFATDGSQGRLFVIDDFFVDKD